MKITQVTEYSENPKQPDDKNNYGNDIKNTFNFLVHWNVIVYKIKDYSHNNKYQQ